MCFLEIPNELSRDYISLGTILQKRKAHAAMFATWALSPKIPSDFEYISFASPPSFYRTKKKKAMQRRCISHPYLSSRR